MRCVGVALFCRMALAVSARNVMFSLGCVVACVVGSGRVWLLLAVVWLWHCREDVLWYSDAFRCVAGLVVCSIAELAASI